MTTTDRYLVVRVTYGTWEQHVIARHRSPSAARLHAAARNMCARRSTYHHWKGTEDG